MNAHLSLVPVICAVLTLGGLPAQSLGMDIVKNGHATAVIVVQEPFGSLDQDQAKRTLQRRTGGFQCNDPAAAIVLADWCLESQVLVCQE